MSKKSTTEEFINKAKKIHGDKYDYSLVDYINSKTKIKIICKKHGIFEQKCVCHTLGQGCPKCTGRNKTTKEFIKEAKQIHDDKYDYSLVNYVGSKIKIKILCKLHKEIFLQKPNNHLMGHGCPKCANKNINTEEFIKKSKLVHGNKYDYSEVVYVKSKSPVRILCKKHGMFLQIPNSHLMDDGCPKCAIYNKESKGENKISKILDNNNIDYVYQKTFKDCKNIFKLSFDFYLPKYNLLIEFDGEQHFKSVEIWGGEEYLKKTQRNDIIKNDYAKKK